MHQTWTFLRSREPRFIIKYSHGTMVSDGRSLIPKTVRKWQIVREEGLFHYLLPIFYFLRGSERREIVNLNSYSLHYRLIPKWAPVGGNQVHICQHMQSIPNGVLPAISRYGTWPIDEPRVVNYQLPKTLPDQKLEWKKVAGWLGHGACHGKS